MGVSWTSAVKSAAGAGGRHTGAVEQLPERQQLGIQGSAPLRCDANPRPRTAARVALLDDHERRLLEHGEVAGEVAGGQVEGLAEVAELDLLHLTGDGEDAEPVPLVHDLGEA